MSLNDAAVDDDYVVKLPNGDARVMSIDELDAALESGKIHKDSPVLAPGTVTWTTLGVLAGLDDVALPVSLSPSSIAPMVVSGGGEIDVDIALDDEDGAKLVPRRRAGKVVGAVFGALAVLAVGFAIKGVVGQALARRAGEAALAAQAPIAAAAPAPPPAPLPPPVVVEAAPAPPVPAPAAAPATSAPSKATAADKDKKKGALPGSPQKTKAKKK